MQRPKPSVPLTCFALLSACMWLAGGCASTPNSLTFTQTPTQTTPTQTTSTPASNSGCVGTCTPFVSLPQWSVGLKPGASVTFSATVYYVSDPSVIWTVKEGPAGGVITDAGVYTAPSTEGVYHVTVTSKANAALSQTATIAVTAAEFTLTGSMSTVRYGHTASLLPDGLVFIAGGENDDYDFADPAELYDATTGTVHPAGQVQVSRIEHTATVRSGSALTSSTRASVIPPHCCPMAPSSSSAAIARTRRSTSRPVTEITYAVRPQNQE